jgi:hypothetical protein
MRYGFRIRSYHLIPKAFNRRSSLMLQLSLIQREHKTPIIDAVKVINSFSRVSICALKLYPSFTLSIDDQLPALLRKAGSMTTSFLVWELHFLILRG